jgi:hypothetical protein
MSEFRKEAEMVELKIDGEPLSGALERSLRERSGAERQRRAQVGLPEARTAGGSVFRYIPVGRAEQVQGCDTDWIFACSCGHVAVILVEASRLSESARAARLRAIGWEQQLPATAWRCPDCVAAWAIVRGGP